MLNARTRAGFVLGSAVLADLVDRRSLLFDGTGGPLADPAQFRVGYWWGAPTISASAVFALAAAWSVGAVFLLCGHRSERLLVGGAGLVMVSSGTVLLLDQQTYANHTWMIWLVSTALVLGGPPVLQTWRLRVLASAAYGFAALAKVRGSWLEGTTLTRVLEGPLGLPLVRDGAPRAMAVLAVVTIVVELALAAWLWTPIPRSWRAVPLAGFHVAILALLGVDAGLVSFALVMLVHLAGEDPPGVTTAVDAVPA